jgi:hypothetical protein
MKKNITIGLVIIASLVIAFILMKNKDANQKKIAIVAEKMLAFP